uniref:Reverse transcriptase domain-containing protein n=1 Tax=Lygus hesperus TaxID=30085 RepID=A0A0K8T700_LYGHE
MKFPGGRQKGALTQFVPAWESLGAPPSICKVLKGYVIPFATRPPLRHLSPPFSPPLITASSKEMDAVVDSLLKQNMIIQCQVATGCISPMFLVQKLDGTHRPVFNLRMLNKFLVTKPFRLINHFKLPQFLQAGDFMTSIDLSQAYCHIPVSTRHQRYLSFVYREVVYNWICLSFGLATAPQVFGQLTNWVASVLRQKTICTIVDLDDFLFAHQDAMALQAHTSKVLHLLSFLGKISTKSKPEDKVSGADMGHPAGADYSSTQQDPVSSGPVEKDTSATVLEPSLCTGSDRISQLCSVCSPTRSPVSPSHSAGRKMAPSAFSSYQISPTRSGNRSTAVVENSSKYAHTSPSTEPTVIPVDRRIYPRACAGLHTEVAYQQEGIICCTNSTVEEPSLDCKSHCPTTIRQNDSGVIHPQAGRTSVNNPPHRIVGTIPANIISRSSSPTGLHSGPLELMGRQTLSRQLPLPDWHLASKIIHIAFQRWGIPEIDLFASHRSKVVHQFVSLSPTNNQAVFIDAFSRQWAYRLAWVFPPPPLLPQVLHYLNNAQGHFMVVAPWSEKAFWMADLKARALAPPLVFKNLGQHLVDLTTNQPPPQVEEITLEVWLIRGGSHTPPVVPAKRRIC